MSESNVLNPPRTVTGGGGGGQLGFDRPGGKFDRPPDDDLTRLARMVERISRTLNDLIHLEPKILPELLAAELEAVWPEAQNNFTQIIKILRSELLIAVPPVNLVAELERAGLTGPMLRMKGNSLYFFLNQIDASVEAYKGQYANYDKPILTYPDYKGIVKTLLGWLKPGFKVMNSILGSLPDVLPGKEIVKELKEHAEAGYEVGEHLAEQREAK
jgi:hypothetical protein